MNKAIANLMNKFLGAWIEDLNSEQLNLSIFSGKICLKELKLKSDFLDILGLPFSLSQGTVKNIEVKIPWSSLYSSPLEITISDINLLLNPTPKSEWNEDQEKLSIHKARKYYLEHFELMNPEDFDMTTTNESGGLLASKLLDNLQLKLENIYVRYEDQINYCENFVLGSFIKTATLNNCNKQWEQNFTSGDFVYKLFIADQVSFFADYEDGIVICREWYEGEVKDCLWELSRDEILGKVCHKFVVSPSYARVKIVVNKEEITLSPLYCINLILDDVKLNLSIAQINYLFIIKKFINEHNLFKRSIEKSIPERSFKPAEIEKYRKVYLSYRQSITDESSTKELKDFLASSLESLEEGIYLDEIILQRKTVINDQKLTKMQKAKKEEIIQMNNKNNQNSIKSFWRYFTTKSKNEIEEEENSFATKLRTAESDLAKLEYRSSEVIRKITRSNTGKLEFITDKIEISVNLAVEHLALEVFDEYTGIIAAEYKDLKIELALRLASVKYIVKSKECVLWNRNPASIFGILLKCNNFEMEYDTQDLKLIKWRTSKLEIFIDIDSIFSVFLVFQKLFKENLNNEESFSSGSSLKTEEEVWRLYTALQEFLEYGVVNSYYVEVLCRNLKIWIPTDSRNENLPILVSEIKEIQTVTEKENKGNLIFEVYKTEFQDFSVFIIFENCQEAVLDQVSFTFLMNICKTRQFLRSGFRFELKFSPIVLNLTEKNISIFHLLQKILNKYVKLCKDRLKKSFEEDLEVDEGEEEDEENEERNQGLDSFVKKLGNIIKTKIFVNFAQISLKFGNGLFLFEDIEGKLKFNKTKNLFFICLVNKCIFQDLGQDFLTAKSSESKTFGIKLLASYLPSDNLVFVSIKLSKIRCCITTSLLKSLQIYYTIYNSPKVNRKSSHLIQPDIKTNNFKFALSIDSIKIKFKSGICRNWDTLKLNSIINFSFNSTDTARYDFTPGLSRISQTIVHSLLESVLMLSNFQVSLKNPYQKKILGQPFRIQFEKIQEFFCSSAPKINSFLSIPQINASLGFRDFEFFYSLYSEFSPFLNFQSSGPKFSSTNILEISSCQIIINDDTIADPIPLINSRFKHVLISQTDQLNLISGEIMNKYFDSKLKAWKIFQDSWKFIVKNSINSENVSEWELTGNSLLEIFLTPNLCEVLGTVHTKVYENSENWEEMYKSSEEISENFDYQIINNLGIQVQFWLESAPNAIYHISPFATCTLIYSDIQKIYTRTSKKNIQLFDNLHKICLEIPGQGVIPGICLQDPNTQQFSIKSFNIRKDLEKSNNFIQIIFSNTLNILNQTDMSLIIGHGDEDFLVQEFFSFPVNWDIEKVVIQNGDCNIPVLGNELIQVGAGKFLGCDQCDFEYNEKMYYKGFLVRPPYVFINLLPFDIEVCIDKFEEIKVNSGNNAQCFSIGISSMMMKIRILIGGRSVETETFMLGHKNQAIKILWGLKSFISINIKDLSKSCIEVSITCEVCLVNYTQYSIMIDDLVISENFSLFYHGNYKNAVNLSIYNENCEYQSLKLDLNTVGLSETLMITPQKKTEPVIIVGVSISNTVFNTKIVKFFPRYLFKNDLPIAIYIRQYSSQTEYPAVQINPNETVHYCITDLKEKQAIQVSDSLTHWSSAFMIDQVDDFQVKFESDKKQCKLRLPNSEYEAGWYYPNRGNSGFFFSRVTVFTENQACVCVIFRTPLKPDYKIVNNTDIDIKIKQKGNKSSYTTIEPGAAVPWVYENHLDSSKKLLIHYENFTQSFNFNRFKEKYKKIGRLSINLYTEGNTRVLELLESFPKNSQFDSSLLNSAPSQTQIIFTCKQISFTLCDQNFSEKALATCSNFQFKYSLAQRQIQKSQNIHSQFNLSIGNFQLDNMNIDADLFPVIISRAYQDDSTPIFQVIYSRVYSNIKQSKTVIKDLFPAFELQFQPVILNINYEIMYTLYTLQQQYLKNYYTNYYKSLTTEPTINFPYSFPNPPEDLLKTYFEFIRIHALDIKMTFRKQKNSKIFSNYSLLFRVFSNKFLDFARITDSPLRFKEVVIQHSFHNRYTILWSLVDNYIRQSLMQFYRILGATQILGNPIGLIDKLGTGVFEFVAEPAKGMLKSYKEFLWGVSKGTRSLVGNLVEGGFESVAGITGSLHYIISEEHSGRNELLNKLGLYDLRNGFRSLTYKPYKGLKDRGLKGFVQEFSTGLCSASLSPISALLHLCHSVSTELASEGKKLKDSNPSHQLRPPLILTPFNDFIKAGNLMQVIKNNKIHLINLRFYAELKHESLIVTDDSIIFIKQGHAYEEIMKNNIEYCEVHFDDRQYMLVIQTIFKLFKIVSYERVPLIKLYFILSNSN